MKGGKGGKKRKERKENGIKNGWHIGNEEESALKKQKCLACYQ